MSTTFHSSKNKSLFLCSPLTLIVLLSILFTYFLTAPNQFSYAKNAEAEVMSKNIDAYGEATE